MAFTIKTESKKSGELEELRRRVQASKNNAVQIGFLSDFNSQYPGGANVLEVAVQNEFGTEKIPSRPFMRRTSIKARPDIKHLRISLIKDILKDKLTIEKALKILGQFYSDSIKHTIQNTEFAPNAPSTIEKKGAGKRPLVDTKKMLNAISWQLTKI